jgi:hypothetical protein
MGFAKTSSVAIAIVSSLVLSGCVAEPVAFKEPLNQCDGRDVALTSTNTRPMISVPFEEFDASHDTNRLTADIFRVAALGNAPADTYRVDYRPGLYNEDGFEHFSGRENISLSGTVERFMPFASEVDDALSRTVDVSRFGSDSTLPELLGLDLGGMSDPEEQALQLLLPGAFIITCLEGAQANEAVSALQMFPNLTTLQDPGFGIVDSTVVLRSSTFEDGAFVFPVIFPVLTEDGARKTLSNDRTTDQWLQFAMLLNEILDLPGDAPLPENVLVNNNGEPLMSYENEVTFTSERVSEDLNPGDYNVFVFVINPSTGTFVTALYEASYSNAGFEGFVKITSDGPTGNPPGGQAAIGTPSVSNSLKPTKISTKGFRSVTLNGSNLDQVTSAFVGRKPAKIVSKSWGEIKLRLPKLMPRSYNLRLEFGTERLVLPNWVTYEKAKVVTQIRLRYKNQTEAERQSDIQLEIAANPKLVQVECFALVPTGRAALTAMTRAEQACEVISSENPNIKTKFKVQRVPGLSKAKVQLSFWN